VIPEATVCNGGYQNSMMMQKFIIRVVNLGNLFLLIKNEMLSLQELLNTDHQKEMCKNGGALGYLRFLGSINRALVVSRFLMDLGLIKLDDGSVSTPYTTADGESKEFYENYVKIIDRMADLEKDG
jgi:hypothetical protein